MTRDGVLPTPKAAAHLARTATYHAELDRLEVPIPTRRQLVEQRGPAGIGFLLVYPNGPRRHIGRYDAAARILTKPHRPGEHYHRNGDGIAWNLELLAIAANRFRPAPAALELRVEPATAGGPVRITRLAWRVARRYLAVAVTEGRYLLTQDVDAQVLIPWDAYAQLAAGPELDPALDPRPAGSPASLFDDKELTA